MKKRGHWHKKGQVTLFILIGLVILLIAGIIYYLATKGDVVGGDERVPILKEAPIEMRPISSYIDKCLLDVGEEALVVAGKHGGYTYPDQSNVKVNLGDPTEGSAIINPVGNDVVPYYYFIESPNTCTGNCQPGTRMPFLRKEDKPNPDAASIEEEVQKYIDNNIDECIDELKVFQEKGWEFNFDAEPKSEVIITGNDVAIILDYPFEAQHMDSTTHTLDQFMVRIPINLEKIYAQAFLIAYLQKSRNYLEHHTMNIINGFSYNGDDDNLLAPVSYLDFDFSNPKYFVEPEEEEKVKSLLETYISWIQVLNSSGYVQRTSNNAGVQAMISQGMSLPGINGVEDLEISFDYFQNFWDNIYFDLCSGMVCKPKSTGISYPVALGVNSYAFQYDLSFPVLIEINQKDARNRKGYAFNFALETNIRNNRPMTLYNQQTINMSYTSSVSELFCNPKQRTSGNITVEVFDSMNNPVEDAAITYSCLHNSCPIGKTDSDGKIVAKFPTCMGGIVTATKPDYLSFSKIASVYSGDEKTINVTMHQQVLVNFSVRGRPGMQDEMGDWRPATGPNDYIYPRDIAGEEDDITVVFERQTLPGEDDFIATAEIYGTEEGQLRLVPGTYNIQVFGINLGQWKIDECVGGGAGNDCVDVNISFDEDLITAAANIEYELKPQQLYPNAAQNKEMIVWAMMINPSNLNFDRLTLMGQMDQITQDNQLVFYPTWKNPD